MKQYFIIFIFVIGRFPLLLNSLLWRVAIPLHSAMKCKAEAQSLTLIEGIIALSESHFASSVSFPLVKFLLGDRV